VANIGSLAVQITGSTTGLAASLRDASSQIRNFQTRQNKGNSNPLGLDFKKSIATSGIDKNYADTGGKLADGLLKPLSAGLTAIFGPAGMLAGMVLGGLGLGAGVSAISDIVSESVKLASEFEDAQVTFKVLLGDMDKSKKLMGELTDLAMRTPLTSQELVQSGTLLAGSGVKGENITGTLRMLGDVASSTNTPLREMALLYNQIRSKGRLMATETLQFAEKQISINELLATSLGKSTSEIVSLTEQGRISFPMVQRALLDATSAGGRFFGMMEERSQTFNGLWSTLVDNWRVMLAKFGRVLIDAFELKPLIKRISVVFGDTGNAVEALKPIFEDMKKWLAEAGKFLVKLFVGGAIAAGTFTNSIITLTSSLDAMLRPLDTASKLIAVMQFGVIPKTQQKGTVLPDIEGETKRLLELGSTIISRMTAPQEGWLSAANEQLQNMSRGPWLDDLGRRFKKLPQPSWMDKAAREFDKQRLIESTQLTADQINKAKSIREEMNPQLKLGRTVDELNQIRELGGFTKAGTPAIFRALDKAGVTNNDAFNFGISKELEPVIRDYLDATHQMAVNAGKGSVEAASIINASKIEGADIGTRTLQAMEAIRIAGEQQRDASRQLVEAIRKTQILQVK
jgi:hypothetical protein